MENRNCVSHFLISFIFSQSRGFKLKLKYNLGHRRLLNFEKRFLYGSMWQYDIVPYFILLKCLKQVDIRTELILFYFSFYKYKLVVLTEHCL